MSNFEEDEELEELLAADPRELDEEKLQELQIYKSHKLQALRDSGESGDRPDWWNAESAPETMDSLAETVGADGETAEAEPVEEAQEEEPVEEEAQAEEEAVAEEETAETEVEPEPAETEEEVEAVEETTEEGAAEPPQVQERETETKREPAATSEGVPQVGWSQGVPQTEELEFDNEILEGIYQRQDELMETLRTLNQGMSEVEVGGEAIEAIRSSLSDLNEKVDALADGQGNEELREKVNELHEFFATARDLETKLTELPPLPEEEELVEAGIIDQPVEHDGSDECFHTSLDNRKAALHYGENPDRLTAYHFSLPSILSEPVRQTIEDVLARALFEYAREENKIVHPQDARLRSGFLARHSEYYELTTDSVPQRRTA